MAVEEQEVLEAISPSAEFLKSSALSVTIMAVLEFQHPIDDSMTIPLLRDVFLPINPRFSSIMVPVKKGVRKWKKVDVNLQDHTVVPVFPTGMSVDYYDECFTEYLTKVSSEQLPENRPLWEVHIVKYPTKSAAGNAVFKLHHSLGDGYSLMGALLSCLQRVDDPTLPLTFPSRQSSRAVKPRTNALLQRVPRFIRGVAHTAYDFVGSLMRSSLMEDEKSPIRSGEEGVEFKAIVTNTVGFSIDRLKEVKNRLNVTVNDVITGVINYGIRLYMQEVSAGSVTAESTAIVVLNTRALEGYRCVQDMIKPEAKMPWGNRFAFLYVPITKLTEAELQNPIMFVTEAHRSIKRQRSSAAVYLVGQLIEFLHKVKGPEATGRFVHTAMKNTSLAISHVIGPVEQMSLANQRVNGLYFFAPGLPQSLQLTMVSYVGVLRIAISVEKGFMDPHKFKACLEKAFEVISEAALGSPTTS